MDQATLDVVASAALFAGYDMVVAMTLFGYDYLLMLRKEVDYIWGAKWSPGKILYLLMRYLPFLDLPIWPFDEGFMGNLPLDCMIADYLEIGTEIIACFLADIVYGLRTWALWNRSRISGCLILLAGISLNISALVMVAVVESVPSQRVSGLPGCFILPTASNEIWKAYMLVTSFQIVLFFATIAKGLHHWKNHPENLTTVLYRDALLAFLAQVAVGCANILLLSVYVRDGMRDINFNLSATYRVVASVLPCRIILNLREAASDNSLDRWDLTVSNTTTAREAQFHVELGNLANER